eukprot:3006186-Pyramimonas_sp.AAC.1
MANVKKTGSGWGSSSGSRSKKRKRGAGSREEGGGEEGLMEPTPGKWTTNPSKIVRTCFLSWHQGP